MGGWGPADGRYRENAVPVTLDFATAGSLWGTQSQPVVWRLRPGGFGRHHFSLKAMPVMRVASQSGQIINLRNNANSGNIGYGFAADELAGGQILLLSGASRGLARPSPANNTDNGTAGTITYGGSALTLAQGDWFMVLPADTNFRYLGMVFNGGDGNLAPFYQEGGATPIGTPALLGSGAVNGYTLMDLGLVAPPTARRLCGYAPAAAGYDLKLAVSYDGSTPALLLHGTPPAGGFQGVRGAVPFSVAGSWRAIGST